jgi:predicted DNA binding CopG/RHH family protein
MATAVMERTYAAPITIEELIGLDVNTRWCLSTHRCRPLFHSLAADEKSSLCIFDCPDAEALRSAAREMETTEEPRIWGASMHYHPEDPQPDGPLMRDGESALAIVQRSFGKPEVFEDLQAMEDAKASCLTLNRVRFIKTFFSYDRRRMACLYAAPDLEAVRKACVMTGLPYDKVLRATIPR